MSKSTCVSPAHVQLTCVRNQEAWLGEYAKELASRWRKTCIQEHASFRQAHLMFRSVHASSAAQPRHMIRGTCREARLWVLQSAHQVPFIRTHPMSEVRARPLQKRAQGTPSVVQCSCVCSGRHVRPWLNARTPGVLCACLHGRCTRA